VIKIFEKTLIIGLYNLTPLHPGSGTRLGIIDLPIQRERHTQYPTIYGQTLKGVLRAEYQNLNNNNKTEILFGPEPTQSDKGFAGAISVGDCKLLLFPVRTMKGVFAYLTSRHILERLEEDLQLAGKKIDINIPDIAENQIIIDTSSKIAFPTQSNKKDTQTVNKSNEKVILEDLLFSPKKEDLSDLTQLIANSSIINGTRLKEKLCIVDDNVYRDLITSCTEIVARTKIDPQTGTVNTGALWYEEYLPTDCLFYSLLIMGEPRKNNEELKNSNEIYAEALNFVKTLKYTHIGGNETTGKGFVKINTISE